MFEEILFAVSHWRPSLQEESKREKERARRQRLRLQLHPKDKSSLQKLQQEESKRRLPQSLNRCSLTDAGLLQMPHCTHTWHADCIARYMEVTGKPLEMACPMRCTPTEDQVPADVFDLGDEDPVA